MRLRENIPQLIFLDLHKQDLGGRTEVLGQPRRFLRYWAAMNDCCRGVWFRTLISHLQDQYSGLIHLHHLIFLKKYICIYILITVHLMAGNCTCELTLCMRQFERLVMQKGLIFLYPKEQAWNSGGSRFKQMQRRFLLCLNLTCFKGFLFLFYEGTKFWSGLTYDSLKHGLDQGMVFLQTPDFSDAYFKC